MTLPHTVKGINQQSLRPAQEHELVLYINRTERARRTTFQDCSLRLGVYPGWESGKPSVDVEVPYPREKELALKATTGIDRNRHQADSRVKHGC